MNITNGGISAAALAADFDEITTTTSTYTGTDGTSITGALPQIGTLTINSSITLDGDNLVNTNATYTIATGKTLTATAARLSNQTIGGNGAVDISCSDSNNDLSAVLAGITTNTANLKFSVSNVTFSGTFPAGPATTIDTDADGIARAVLLSGTMTASGVSYTLDDDVTITVAVASKLSGMTITGSGTIEITGAVTTEDYSAINVGGVTFSTTASPNFAATLTTSEAYTLTTVQLKVADAADLDGMNITGDGTIEITGAVTGQDFGSINVGGVTFSAASPQFAATLTTSEAYTLTGVALTVADASKLDGMTITGTGTIEIAGAVTNQDFGAINVGGVTFSTANSPSFAATLNTSETYTVSSNITGLASFVDDMDITISNTGTVSISDWDGGSHGNLVLSNVVASNDDAALLVLTGSGTYTYPSSSVLPPFFTVTGAFVTAAANADGKTIAKSGSGSIQLTALGATTDVSNVAAATITVTGDVTRASGTGKLGSGHTFDIADNQTFTVPAQDISNQTVKNSTSGALHITFNDSTDATIDLAGTDETDVSGMNSPSTNIQHHIMDLSDTTISGTFLADGDILINNSRTLTTTAAKITGRTVNKLSDGTTSINVTALEQTLAFSGANFTANNMTVTNTAGSTTDSAGFTGQLEGSIVGLIALNLATGSTFIIAEDAISNFSGSIVTILRAAGSPILKLKNELSADRTISVGSYGSGSAVTPYTISDGDITTNPTTVVIGNNIDLGTSNAYLNFTG